MSSVNTNRNQEQNEGEGTIELVPPYHNDVESFDNPDKFPDLEFVVGGMEKTTAIAQEHSCRVVCTRKDDDE